MVRDSLPNGVYLKDLGEHRLKDLQRGEQIYQALSDSFPALTRPLKSLNHHLNNLPTRSTRLIGRVKQVGELTGLLTSTERLVTLTGPAGTGKTRLAVQVAAELLDEFKDGVWFIDLAPKDRPELVLGAIAEVLDLREAGEEPLVQTLIAHLRPKHVLFVLDNFEHVAQAAPQIATVVKDCSHIRVLVTSRVRLGLSDERVYPVTPLGLPSKVRHPALTELAQVESVELFVEHARELKPNFHLTERDAIAVSEICVRLGGLPMAITLAARRINAYTMPEMLSHMDNLSALALLTIGDRDISHHQTMRDAIDWSYQLLPMEEQRLFRQLAVFSGSWSREAAAAVCGQHTKQGRHEISPLDNLVEWGIISTEDIDGNTRFTMPMVIREFGMAQLKQHREIITIQSRHAEFFTQLALQVGLGNIVGPNNGISIAQFTIEHDNLQAALRWLCVRNARMALQLGTALWPYWSTTGFLTEGRKHLQSVLTASSIDSDSLLRAQVLAGAGWLAQDQDDYQEARRYSVAALAIYEETANQDRSKAIPLICLGVVELKLGNPDGAAFYWEKGEELARLSGDEEIITQVFLNRGQMLMLREYNDEADQLRILEDAAKFLTEALHLARQHKDQPSELRALGSLGRIELERRDYIRATMFYASALRLARQLERPRWMALVFLHCGYLAYSQARYGRALARFRRCLMLAQQTESVYTQIQAIEEMARTWLETDQVGLATQLLSATDVLRMVLRLPRNTKERQEFDVVCEEARALDAVFERHWGMGQQMSIAQTVRLAYDSANRPGGNT